MMSGAYFSYQFLGNDDGIGKSNLFMFCAMRLKVQSESQVQVQKVSLNQINMMRIESRKIHT